MNTRIVLLTACAILVGFASAAQAPPPPTPDIPAPPTPPGMHRGDGPFEGFRGMRDVEGQDAREVMETIMIVRLSRELELTDEQSVLLVRHVSEFKDRIREIKEERKETLRGLRQALKSGAEDHALQQKLDAVVQLDHAAVDLTRNMVEEAGRDLTVAQKAKLYVFLGDFEREMRHLVQRAKMRRGGDGGDGERPDFRRRRENFGPGRGGRDGMGGMGPRSGGGMGGPGRWGPGGGSRQGPSHPGPGGFPPPPRHDGGPR